MRKSIRILVTALLFLGIGAASVANAIPITYSFDVEISIDNGIGLAPGAYTGAGSLTADVPAPTPPGLVGATILDLTVVLGGDTWTLADATSDPMALALLDGTAIGLLFTAVNANGHLVTLGFDPAVLAVADLNDPAANHFAYGGYALAAVPEPGVALLVALGVLGLATSGRRSSQTG